MPATVIKLEREKHLGQSGSGVGTNVALRRQWTKDNLTQQTTKKCLGSVSDVGGWWYNDGWGLLRWAGLYIPKKPSTGATNRVEEIWRQARDPLLFSPGTIRAVHTTTVSVIIAFHISTSEGPVGGDTPIPLGSTSHVEDTVMGLRGTPAPL